jgi:predicted Zn finger-like uncharacterized protein
MFMDCPKCGTEFVVKDDQVASVLRCPDCLQWLESEMDASSYAKAYYGSTIQDDHRYEDYDSENYGYDY